MLIQAYHSILYPLLEATIFKINEVDLFVRLPADRWRGEKSWPCALFDKRACLGRNLGAMFFL